MHHTTGARGTRVLVWLFWFVALLALAWGAGLPGDPLGANREPVLLAGLALPEPARPGLFPWLSQGRWRRWARRRYQAARRAYWRARWVYYRALGAAGLARLPRSVGGVLTMATVVDLLTRAQLRRQLGALPVLPEGALLEILQVRQVINRHCPTAAEIDHGTVALVLVLNRLTAPRALWRIADWLAQTVLVQTLGVPAAKFNDDRLGRTLDAIAAQQREIWLGIVHEALLRFDIDLRFIFYDLTAFVMQGEFSDSDLAAYGFAHNTPMGKKKVKLGVAAASDGAVPTEYAPLSGRTADLATVQDNMDRLCRLLERHGYPVQEVLVIGDRGTLNPALALKYDEKRLKYLAGLQPQKKEHRELLRAVPTAQFRDCPLTTERGARGRAHRRGATSVPCASSTTARQSPIGDWWSCRDRCATRSVLWTRGGSPGPNSCGPCAPSWPRYRPKSARNATARSRRCRPGPPPACAAPRWANSCRRRFPRPLTGR